MTLRQLFRQCCGFGASTVASFQASTAELETFKHSEDNVRTLPNAPPFRKQSRKRSVVLNVFAF